MSQHPRIPQGYDDDADYMSAWDWITSLLHAACYVAGALFIACLLAGMAYGWWML
jgi:hypothetical protein